MRYLCQTIHCIALFSAHKRETVSTKCGDVENSAKISRTCTREVRVFALENVQLNCYKAFTYSSNHLEACRPLHFFFVVCMFRSCQLSTRDESMSLMHQSFDSGFPIEQRQEKYYTKRYICALAQDVHLSEKIAQHRDLDDISNHSCGFRSSNSYDYGKLHFWSGKM